MNIQTVLVLMISILIPCMRAEWWRPISWSRPGWFRRKATISRNLTMDDSRKLAIDVGTNDWCMDRSKSRSAARVRCERGHQALLKLKHESDCNCGSAPKCRYVPRSHRRECTVLPAPTDTVTCPARLYGRNSKRALIKFSDCIQSVIATLPPSLEAAEMEDVERNGWPSVKRLNSLPHTFHHLYSLSSKFPPSKITEIENRDEMTEKIKENVGKLIMVVLYAKLCDKWIRISGEVEKLAGAFQNSVAFFKHDMDKKLEGLELYEESPIPSFMFMIGNKNGEWDLQEVPFHTTDGRTLWRKLLGYGVKPDNGHLSPQRSNSRQPSPQRSISRQPSPQKSISSSDVPVRIT
nr:PREDICTED: uncharacterized protein LOC109041987 isoform X1 [Bemisia tabaci]